MEVVTLAAKIRAGFMVILLAALIVYVVDILSPEEIGQIYVVYFEDSVAGLEKNASVQYNGIQIGFVLSIEPFPTNFGMLNKVKLRITSQNEALKIYRDADTISYLEIDSFGSVAQEMGLTKNYSIIKINGNPVVSERDFNGELAKVYNSAYKTKIGQDYSITIRNSLTKDEKEVTGNTDKGKLLVTFVEADSLERGTRASLNQNFVTGIKWVELSGGNKTLIELKGSPSEETVSDEQEILTQRGFFAKLTSEQNINRISRVINDMESIIINVTEITNSMKQKIPSILTKVDNFLDEENGELRKLMNNLNETLDSAEKLWGEEGGQLHDGLAELRGVISKVKEYLDEDGQVSALLKDLSKFTNDTNDLLNNKEKWLAQTGVKAQDMFESIDKQLNKNGELYKSLQKMNDLLTEIQTSLTKGEIHKRIKEMGQLLRNLDRTFSRDFRGAMLSFNKAMNEFYEGLAAMTANPENFIIGVKNRK